MIDIILKPIRSLLGLNFLKSKPKIEKNNDEVFSVEDIYTPLSVAKEEIWRRWNDKELRKKVEDFLGGDLPEFSKKGPCATLVRDVVSPTKEFCYFMDLAKQIELEPACVEYLDGKFVAKNLNKYYLGKMFFHNGVGKKGGDRIDTLKVINFNKEEGKKIKKIKTLWGQNFCQFHCELAKKMFPNVDLNNVSDISEWFNKHRGMSEYYYLHYLALFLVHGVLFENFITKNGEKEFTKNKIIPSFYKLQEIFGIKPLIVPIASIEDECELYWWYYPQSAKEMVNSLNKNETFQAGVNNRMNLFNDLSIEIRDTKKYGFGVFANRDIKKGETIKILSGEKVSLEECLKRIENGSEDNNDPLQIGRDLYMDLDRFSHAFNHSCSPNAGLRKTSELFAMRNIKKGEEVTYDYSLTVGPNNPPSEFTMECACGKSHCRKSIGNILTIPDEIFSKYVREDALQDYIKIEFKDILNNIK